MNILLYALFFVIGVCIGDVISNKIGQRQIIILKSQLESQNQVMQSKIDFMEKQYSQIKLDYQQRIKENNDSNQRNFEQYKEGLKERELERKKALENEFKSLASSILDEKQKKLSEINNVSFSNILTPLKEHLANLNKTIIDVNVRGTKDKASLEEIIKGLMVRTEEVSREAVNLTKALKGDSKLQGDWGEMILERLLEQSGLRRDEEFYVQESIMDNSGKKFRPDVIVRLPKSHSIIIDSKVSLTAYANAVNATSIQKKDECLQQHLLSIHKHIDELAAKDYGSLVDGADKFVLMFIPNESSYIAAVQAEPDLSSKAYQKHIIVVSPTSLIMTLQLAKLIWQTEHQFNNVEDIIKKCSALYDKVVGFTDSFLKVGDSLNKTKESYDNALGQLSTGRGNVIGRLEKIKDLGLNPSKKINYKLTKNADIDEETIDDLSLSENPK